MSENEVVSKAHAKSDASGETPPPERRKGVAGLLRAALDSGRAFLLGYDLFISYRRKDANDYALALTNRLTKLGFRCYLDQFSAPGDREIPEEVMTALRNSTALVVIGTPLALESEAIGTEVKTFSRLRRTILPINVAGTLDDRAWEGSLAGSSMTDETHEAVAKKKRPSAPVLVRLNGAAKFKRRNRQLQRTFFSMLAGIAVLLLAGGVSARALWQQAAAAKKDADRALARATDAEQRRKDAETAAGVAEEQRLKAEGDRDKALKDLGRTTEELDLAREDLTTAQDEERAARAEAEEQTRIADAQRREAERQGTIAASRELLARAQRERILGTDPFKEPLRLAVKAYDTYPSSEPDDMLRYGLEHNQKLVACEPKDEPIQALAYGPAGGDRKQNIYALGQSTVYVLDGDDGRERDRFTPPGPLPNLLRMSGDGQTVAALRNTPGGNGRVDVFETASKRMKGPPLEFSGGAGAMVVSAYGRHVAAISGADSVKVLEVGKGAREMKPVEARWALTDLLLSDDGKFAAAIGWTAAGPARHLVVWDTATGEKVIDEDHQNACEGAYGECITSLKFSGVPAFALAFATPRAVYVYDTGERRLVKTIPARERPITTINFLDGGITFVVADDVGRLRYVTPSAQWEETESSALTQGERVKQVLGIPVPGYERAWIQTVTDDTVHLWGSNPRSDRMAADEAGRLSHDAPIAAVIGRVLDDKTQFVTASGVAVRLWERAAAASGVFLLTGVEEKFASVPPNGRYAAIAGEDFYTVFDTSDGRVVEQEGPPTTLARRAKRYRAAVTPDARYLLTEAETLTTRPDDPSIYALRLRDRTEGRDVLSRDDLKLFGSQPFGDDLQYLSVSNTQGGERRIISTRGAGELPLGDAQDVSFSRDGRHFAVTESAAESAGGGRLFVVKVKRLARDGRGSLRADEVASLPHQQPVSEVSLSNLGRYVVTASGERHRTRRTLWSSSGQLLKSFDGHVPVVVFSNDDRRVAVAQLDWTTGRRSVEVYETAGMQLVRSFAREFDVMELGGLDFLDLAFDSKAERLAVASEAPGLLKSRVWVWPVSAGREADPLSYLSFSNKSRIRFSEGDRNLIVFGGVGAGLVSLSTEAMLRDARRILSSHEECAGADIKSQ